MTVKAMSLEDLIDKVSSAIRAASRNEWGDSYAWTIAVFEDHAIACWEKTGKHYKVSYTLTNEVVAVAPQEEWEEVSQEWVVKSVGPLISIGGSAKALDQQGAVGGYLIRFTDVDHPDLTGDFFTRDTDYDAQDGDRSTVYYNHGLDSTLKRRKIGVGTLKFLDDGVWVEAQLNLRDQYEQRIWEMAQAGKLGWSSGTLPNLVERELSGKNWRIKTWPLGKDASLTPTPAAGPELTRVIPLKMWADAAALQQAGESQEAGDASMNPASEKAAVGNEESQPKSSGGKTKMPNSEQEQKIYEEQLKSVLNSWRAEAVDAPIDELKTQVNSMNDAVTRLLDMVEGLPSRQKAGYLTDDGGDKDPQVKSFGDFLVAIRRKDHKRLARVYKSYPIYDNEGDAEGKDLSISSGGSGGYLVPAEYAETLLQISPQTSPILGRVQTIPITRISGDWPTLDQYLTPQVGTGQTAFAGGVKADLTAPGGTLPSTEPEFEMLQWRVHKIGGYTQVDNELIADSPMAIEALLRGLFNVAVSAKHEYYILRGTGVGEPLGILNSQAIVQVSPTVNDLFSWPDVAKMQSRFKKVGTGPASWLIHPSIWPDILTMEVGTNGGAVWAANMAAAAGNTLNGAEILQSEHLPQANSSGAAILADLFAYLLFRRQELSIAFSEHAGFLNDKATWRFTARADGKPWLRKPVTLADPQGSYTVSPFVVHND